MQHLFLSLTLWLTTSAIGENFYIVTAYCPCIRCCGPGSPKPTASGVWPKQGRTAATNKFPFGTKLEIEGVGVRIVEDRMPKDQMKVDIYFDSHQKALEFGKQKRKVKVIQWPSKR